MAYRVVPTVSTGDAWTAINHNTYIKDNFASGVPDIFTTAGDMIYASTANAGSRLGIGTAGQYLRMNSAETGVEWGSPSRVVLEFIIYPPEAVIGQGNSAYLWYVPDDLIGWNITAVHAIVNTASTSGTVSIQLYNGVDAADVLSTVTTIDQDEYTSYTAAAPHVIDTNHDDIAEDDWFRVDIDDNGTGVYGLTVRITVEEA